MNPLISVIIPVFNVKEYLNEAVFSVLDGEYKNIEVFLIDDGSNDGSGEICDEIAKIDKRVIVIHQKNAGISGARNTALALAKGEYFAFVDSDDIVSKDFLHTLYELIKKYDVKMSGIGIDRFVNVNEINFEDNNINEKYFSQKGLIEELCTLNEQLGLSVCNKLYHKSVFDGVKFPVGRLYEDVAISFKLISNAKSSAFSQKKCYFYRIRDSSITNTEFSKKHLDAVKSAKEFYNDANLAYPKLNSAFVLSYFMMITAIRIIKSKNREFYHYLDEYCVFIRRNFKKIFLAKRVNKLTKLLIISLGISVAFFKFIFITYTIYKNIKKNGAK